MGENTCRTSQGVRGLKLFNDVAHITPYGRTSHGVRGLKRLYPGRKTGYVRRTSQGVRGLKRTYAYVYLHVCSVAPRKGCVD